MKKENDKTPVVTPKTVIFCHPVADFKLDRNIRRNAVYIRDCYLENHEERVIYYAMKIKKAFMSKKSYMVVNFSQLVIQVFEAILTNQDTWDYKDWSFMAFFHDDEESSEGKIISADVKRDILIGMYHNSYMMEYTIPRGHTLTEQDIKAIKEWWDWPNKETTIEELFNYSRKLPFPFYDIIEAYKKLSKGEENSGTGTRQHHSSKAKNSNF
ncbi:MAG: hypothetical protein LBQ93_01585 [Treponema sp.]|nr:hypothetical protein [Treponema sp.]